MKQLKRSTKTKQNGQIAISRTEKINLKEKLRKKNHRTT